MPQPPSAGILLFRARDGGIEVLLIKPGGPFWRNRDEGAWMIPKGAIEPGETPVDAAIREFEEEVGTRLTAIPFPLCTIKQSGGKTVKVFAAEGDLDPTAIATSTSRWNGRREAANCRAFPKPRTRDG
jgi:predicted NUDIX family NTP pyrophosphohydrolase